MALCRYRLPRIRGALILWHTYDKSRATHSWHCCLNFSKSLACSLLLVSTAVVAENLIKKSIHSILRYPGNSPNPGQNLSLCRSRMWTIIQIRPRFWGCPVHSHTDRQTDQSHKPLPPLLMNLFLSTGSAEIARFGFVLHHWVSLSQTLKLKSKELERSRARLQQQNSSLQRQLVTLQLSDSSVALPTSPSTDTGQCKQCPVITYTSQDAWNSKLLICRFLATWWYVN